MTRKTVDLDLLVKVCNNVLALPDKQVTNSRVGVADDARSYRAGVMGVCEMALQMASAYKGFQYLPSEFVEGDPTTLREGYDYTRREYCL